MSKLEKYVGALPSAVDIWLAVIILVHVFGKPVPWYLWLLLGCEIGTLICREIVAKPNKE